MRGPGFLVLTVASWFGACERNDVPSAPSASVPSTTPPKASAPIAAPSSPTTDGPVVKSDVSVPGLRVTSGPVGHDATWGFSDLAVDLHVVRLEAVSGKPGGRFEDLLPVAALAVINGGYFELDFRPSAWLVTGGKQLAPRGSVRKGGVLAVSAEGDVHVGSAKSLAFAPDFAVQSFPLIVEENGKAGIRSDDGRRAARNVACLVGTELHFVLIAAPRGDGPTLFEAMTLLREPRPRGFGCTTALNLDGGPSVGVFFAPSIAARPRLPLAPIAYGIALSPR